MIDLRDFRQIDAATSQGRVDGNWVGVLRCATCRQKLCLHWTEPGDPPKDWPKGYVCRACRDDNDDEEAPDAE